MSIKINIKKNISIKLIKNHVLFTDKDFKINGLSGLKLGKDAYFIKNSVNSHKLSKKNFVYFNISPSTNILLVKIIS